MLVFNVLRNIVARLLFGAHSFVLIFLAVITTGNNYYWLLTVAIGFQILEALIRTYSKRLRLGSIEWVSLPVLFYLTGAVPAIIVNEWQLLETRLYERDQQQQQQGQRTGTNGTANPQPSSSNSNFRPTVDKLHLGSNVPGLDLDITIQLGDNHQVYVRILEQTMMLLLIFGRWLLPTKGISRDQLSQLLLVYVAMAADTLELFEALVEEQVKFNRALITALLSLFSLSLIQFCITITAIKQPRPPAIRERPVRIRVGDQATTSPPSAGAPQPPSSTTDAPPTTNETSSDADGIGCAATCNSVCHKIFSTEIWALFLSVLLQDGPYLVFRLLLIIGYRVLSYTNLFFTTKNAVACVLQIYRIMVLVEPPSKVAHLTEVQPGNLPNEGSNPENGGRRQPKTVVVVGTTAQESMNTVDTGQRKHASSAAVTNEATNVDKNDTASPQNDLTPTDA